MAQTTVKYPTVAADIGGGTASAVAWTNPSNATGAPDSASATNSIYRNDPKGENSNTLKLSSIGLGIPSTAVITGIQAVITGSVTPSSRGGVNVSVIKANGTSGQLAGGSYNYGSNGDTGGLTLTAADVNATGFGIGLQIWTWDPNQSIALSVDAVQVTVFWDYPPLPIGTVQKQYVYQVFRQGVYLGLLPNVISDFNPSQDINTAGTSITVDCAVTADVSAFDVPILETEDGNPLQTEAGDTLTLEAYPDVIGNNNSNALFRNGNQIIIWEYSDYHPNGIQVFTGDVERWEASFGTSAGDTVKITCYSDGADLNNFLITGGDTLDQSQTGQNTTLSLQDSFGSGKGGGWNKYGQTFVIGGGITNLEGISILTLGGANITVSVYSSVASANSGGAALASVTQNVPVYGTPTEVKFVFAPILSIAAGTTLFFALDTDSSTGVSVYMQNTDVYASGQAYNSNYGGGSGGGAWGGITGDLWFKTWYGGNSTTSVYSSTDPTNMVTDMLTRYNAKGGLIKTASGSMDLTGLSLGYTFKVATLLEGIQKAEQLAPYNWYWYVDIGSNTLYFKQTATTAKWQLVKGRHIAGLNLAASTENVKNLLYFTGGIPAGNTTNVFSSYSDAGSIQNNKQRLARQTDNRVTVQGTADAIGNSYVGANKNETYQTSVTVLDSTMDISQFRLGDTVGFGGFGNFIDNLILQVVRIQKTPEQVTMVLGELPPQVNQTIKNIEKSLVDLQTLQNP